MLMDPIQNSPCMPEPFPPQQRSSLRLLGTVQPRTAAPAAPLIAAALEHHLSGAILPTEVGQDLMQPGQVHAGPGGSEDTTFIYCTAGKGWCEFDNQRLAIKPGELHVMTAGVLHRCGPELDASCTIHWVRVRGKLVNEYLTALGVGERHTVLPVGHDARLIGLFGELLDVLAEDCGDDDLLCGASILQHMMGIFIRARRRKKAGAPDAAQRVAASIEFMKSNLTRTLDIAMLSDLAKVSPSHYSTLFKRQTGHSPVDYLIRLRIQVASELLDNTNHDIKTIAAKLGYKDPLYFSRVFVGVQGVSPSEYRRRARAAAQAGERSVSPSGFHKLSTEPASSQLTSSELRASVGGRNPSASCQEALELAQVK